MTHALLSLLLSLQDPDADQKKLDACAENLRRRQNAHVACAEKATDKPSLEFTRDMLNEKGEVLDPWGRPLVYVNQAQNYPKNLEDKSAHNKTSFDLWSAGPDGNDDRGANDDPNNWD